MRVALVENDTVWEDPAANRKKIAASLPAADLVLLPEQCFSGFSLNAAPDPEAEPFLGRMAKLRKTAIVAGYTGEGPRNMAVAVTSAGEVAGRYAKMHPFSHVGEDERVKAGDDVPVFGLAGMRVALTICYDLRFPEVFREAALKGAELFCVLANWPDTRIDHWHALLRARAIENQAFVLGVNRVGSDPNANYVSSSAAIDPRGVLLHEGPGVFELDPDAARLWRAEFPALRDARRDRYRFGPA